MLRSQSRLPSPEVAFSYLPDPGDDFSYRNFSFRAFDAVLLFIECSKCKNQGGQNFTIFRATETRCPSIPFVSIYIPSGHLEYTENPQCLWGIGSRTPLQTKNLHACDFTHADKALQATAQATAHAHGRKATVQLFSPFVFGGFTNGLLVWRTRLSLVCDSYSHCPLGGWWRVSSDL